MFNAIYKLLIILTVVGLFASCGDSDKKAATALIDDARSEMALQNYDAAIALLDTLDAHYPKQTELRREAMHLRPRIIEQQALRQLTTTDSLIAVLTLTTDSLRDVLVFVPDAFEGYYTSKKLKDKIPANAPGLYARMSTDGVFTVISSAKKGVESTSVSLSTPTATVSTPTVACDGERNDRSRGVEIITFMPTECDTLGVFAMQNAGKPLTVTWNGSRSATEKLSQPQADALAEVYSASRSFGALRRASMQKQLLERRLDIARSQMARTFNSDSTDTEK